MKIYIIYVRCYKVMLCFKNREKSAIISRFTQSMNEDNCILLKELEWFQFQYHNTVTQLSTC